MMELIHSSECSVLNCKRKALWIPVIKILAKGYPKTSTPLRIETNIQLCENHKEEIKPHHLDADFERMILDMCKANKVQEPDISTAVVELEALLETN